MACKMGRPLKPINWEEFDKLVSYQCTQKEICDFFDVDWATMNTRLINERGFTFSEVWSKKKSLGKIRLRKAQLNNVEAGAPGWAAMAIYLDKKFFPEERIDLPPPIDVPPQSIIDVSRQTAQPVSFSGFCEKAGYPKPYPKQEEMREFAFSHNEPRLCLGARGYGKSDYMTILGTAYEIYLDWFMARLNGTPLTETNLIISKSKVRNTAMLEEAANALIANGVPLEKQNASCIRVEGLVGKDHSIEVLPLKSSFRGRHPKRILMDDPVTEEDTSEAMRILVKKKYDEAYKLCKNICIIGQPAHAFDLYAELREIILKLEVPHGTIPELDADLNAMVLAGVDRVSIEMSYHLRIPKDGAAIFSNINFIPTFPQADSVAFIDPSDGGDYTAMSCIVGYMDGVAVHGKAWKKAWYHALDDIVETIRARKVRMVAFETNKFGTQPIEQLSALLSPYGIGVVGIHSESNKKAMITAAGSYAHMIHLSKDSDKVYTDQVTKYDHSSKYDDCPDSLARGLEWLKLLRTRK